MEHDELMELLLSNRQLNIFAVVDLGEAGEMIVPMEHERLIGVIDAQSESDDPQEIPCNQLGEFLYVGVTA